MYPDRLRRLADRQREAGVDCVACMPGPNMMYLSGLPLFMSERPIVFFFPREGRPAAIVPALEQGRAQAMVGSGVDLFGYRDEDGAEGAFLRVAEALSLDGKRVAVEYLHMRVLELRALEAAAPAAQYVSLEKELAGLRTVKDAAELDAIRGAIDLTEQALERLLAKPLIGLSEREIAGLLSQEMMSAGADRIAFIIVVAGPNGADPHRGPSDRPVQAGELLTIDCGLYRNGYLSDITRTFALGQVSAELETIYQTVLRANQAGKDAVRAGVAAQDVDRAARKVIEDAGYGAFFFHRTGHGMGIETHEPPYIVEGNELLLEPGMVFSVEPGIYVKGLGGVRIEDDVAVTEGGVDCLTSFGRELRVIG